MTQAESIELRGFDSYRVTLGDEMRGLRATKGKSLLDVQRDLRIKAAHIAALENADPSAVPHKGYLKGYLRAYARYLGMDEAEVMRRFCEEAGVDLSAGATVAATGRTGRAAYPGGRRDDLDAAIAGSRLAAASRAAAMNTDLGATLRGLGSLAALAALVAGLGYGGWAVLENIQRVDFAPQPQAPEALAEAPDLGLIARLAGAGAAAPSVDAEALAAVYAAQESPPPPPALRDGPISAIDPARAGVYAAADPEPAPEMVRTAGFAPVSVPLDRTGLPAQGLAGSEPGLSPAEANLAALARTAPPPAPKGLALVIAEDAWLRVRDGGGRVLHEALMRAGAVWRAPEDAEGMTLRAGNAAGVFVEIDGALYGPLGGRGEVVSNIALDPEAVAEKLPAANPIDALVEATLTSSLTEAELR